MTQFSFDYKGYHIIVNPEVNGIIEAYVDSEDDKVLFKIDYSNDFEDKDKLIAVIKSSLDGRINRKSHKNILTGSLALQCLRAFNKSKDKELYFKAIEHDLEILKIIKK